jgi:hypothetical protein
LLQEGELSREVLGEVNAELSSVYSILWWDLRWLKKDHNEKFSQLMNRIEGRCKEKWYTYDEWKVLQHVQNILSILDTEKEISL